MAATACSEDAAMPTTQPSIQQGGAEAEAPLERVPDMCGFPLENLVYAFKSLGFTPSLAMFVSDEPKDTVLFIEHMGQLARVPSSIEVHVSAGPSDWDAEATAESELSTQQQRFERMDFGGIEWLVLEEGEGKVLLLSEYVLFDKSYHTEWVPITWEESSLRSYLNNEFFNSFSPEERERIAETRVANGDALAFRKYWSDYGSTSWLVPGGNDTDDRIFLLSTDEQKKYFATDSSRVAKRLKDDDYYPGEDWMWWLRTPGTDNYHAKAIVPTGADHIGYSVTRSFGIRPALWLWIE